MEIFLYKWFCLDFLVIHQICSSRHTFLYIFCLYFLAYFVWRIVHYSCVEESKSNVWLVLIFLSYIKYALRDIHFDIFFYIFFGIFCVKDCSLFMCRGIEIKCLACLDLLVIHQICSSRHTFVSWIEIKCLVCPMIFIIWIIMIKTDHFVLPHPHWKWYFWVTPPWLIPQYLNAPWF